MAKLHKRLAAALVGAAALSLTLTACGGESAGTAAGAGGGGGEAIDTATATGEINYWLWDTNQLPAYQACADAFTDSESQATVKISQFGWDDYWSEADQRFRRR